MPNLNRVLLIGNCTRDPELRYTPKGTPVAELDIAVNRTYSGDDGEKKEEVTYISITLWARLAELAGQYLRKGSPLFIEGRLQLDTWDDKQTGQKRSRLRIVGENLQLLGQRPSAETASSGPPRPPATRPEPVSGPHKVKTPLDEPDDIPF
jgi:single-strand DNA-binding protein